MADYTPYQKGIIKRYYEHRETSALQKLAETVSELYLADTPGRKKRLWASVEKQLAHVPCPVVLREKILSEHDLEGLASLLADLYGK